MSHTWYVIDSDGKRPVNVKTMDFWSKFKYSGDHSEWPEFTQFVVGSQDATPDLIERCIVMLSATLGFSCTPVENGDITEDGMLALARNGDAWCLAEPGTDVDERLLNGETADQLAGLLAADAGFFGFSNAAGTLHVTTFETGAPELAWFDSTSPGPSFARVFHRNGSCTDEDPRSYALRVLDMPATSPLLDRYVFVATMIEPLGVERIEPELKHLEIVKSWRLSEA